MVINEKDFKEMSNLRQLKIIPRDENLFRDVQIAVHGLDKNFIIKDFPLTEGFYHPFLGYRKPAFQKPSDQVVYMVNTFISGMIAHYQLNKVV